MAKYSLGIDIGTTSICGVRFDASSNTVDRAITLPNDASLNSPQPWERIQDPERILNTALRLLDELFSEDVVSIGFSGQMHGIVYLNEEGRAVSPLYTWQDGRGNLPYEGSTYASVCGSMTGYGNVTDFYNRINGLVPECAVGFCTIHDYAAMTLCGRRTPIIHTSNAASFGLFDLVQNKFNVDFAYPVTDRCEVLGYYKNIPVTAALGDNQASFIGSGADLGAVLVNVGTGSQISMMTESIPSTIPDGMEVRPLTDGKRIIVGSALCGGRAFAMLHDLFCDIAELATGVRPNSLYAEINRMLESATDATLKVDTSFSGTRHDPERRGSITNIDTNNLTPTELALGFLGGEADELYEYYDKLDIKADRLVGTGNGIRRSPTLRRLFSDRFGMPLTLSPYEEEAACGAAIFSLNAVK